MKVQIRLKIKQEDKRAMKFCRLFIERKRIHCLKVGLFLIVLLHHTGCSLFLGSIKPAEEKSNSYEILDLSKNDSQWIRLEPQEGTEPSPNGASDVAYQSKKTASIISINSACKSYA